MRRREIKGNFLWNVIRMVIPKEWHMRNMLRVRKGCLKGFGLQSEVRGQLNDNAK